MSKRLTRSNDKRILTGVCGGLAEHFGWDPTVVRLALVAFCLLGGSGILAYILATIIMPRQPALPGADYRALR